MLALKHEAGAWFVSPIRFEDLLFLPDIYLYLIMVDYKLFPEKAMAPHSSTLAWKIPQTEDPGGPQSMGLLRVGHD